MAMVAMANHRADSPKTGWRIGVDTSRSTTHRVCESEHAFASCGGGRGEYLLTRRVWSAHGARRSSQRTQGGSCAVWGAQRLPKNWCRTTSGTPARARACRVASRMSAPSLPKSGVYSMIIFTMSYAHWKRSSALETRIAKPADLRAPRLPLFALSYTHCRVHGMAAQRGVRGGPRRRGRCPSTRCAVLGRWWTC